ncbi:MAG: hypothetical protein WAM24_09175 [Ignavibacteriaceae bacterium]
MKYKNIKSIIDYFSKPYDLIPEIFNWIKEKVKYKYSKLSEAEVL